MAVLALGLLIGQQAALGPRRRPLSFVAALIAGLGVLTFGVVPRLMNEAVLLVALTSGRAGGAGAAVAGTGGLRACRRHRLRHRARFAARGRSRCAEANLMLIGTAFGGALLLIVVVEIATRLTVQWQRIARADLGLVDRRQRRSWCWRFDLAR